MKLLKVAWILQIVLLSNLGSLSAEESDRKQFDCSSADVSIKKAYRLTQYSRENVPNATWGTAYEEGKFASCGFTDGHKIKLTDMNLFADRSAVFGKNLSVYRGIGNHCSEGQVLIFNERTNVALILQVHSALLSKYQCTDGK